MSDPLQTRLPQVRWLMYLSLDHSESTRHGDGAALIRMAELTMATHLSIELPAISLQHPDHVANLHPIIVLVRYDVTHLAHQRVKDEDRIERFRR